MKPIRKTPSAVRSSVNSLTSLALLCTACSTHDASDTTSPTVLQSNIVQSNRNPADLDQKEIDKIFAYLDTIMKNVIVPENDPGIEICRVQKKASAEASSSDSEGSLSSDEDLACISLIFRDLPGEPPYNLHCRRLLQEDPNAFLPRPLEQAFLNAIHSKNIPFSIVLVPQGFLPGERVTWRVSGTDGTASKEVTVCPRPMILKDKSGKTILEAALLSIYNPSLCYLIHLPAQDEVVEFISNSGEETLKQLLPLGESANVTLMPAIKGVDGGVSQIEVRFLKDRSSYKMQLPWGKALLDYSAK